VLLALNFPADFSRRVLRGDTGVVRRRHYLVIAQGRFLKAMPAADILSNALPLAIIAASHLDLATWMLRSKLQ
jgi:ABC-2 type transport system permease protein